jgi:nicotinate-nucleotide adenylyltransferase
MALFGGTFDPIHLGHLVIAEQVADALGMERVVFVPSGIPPHKAPNSIVASAEDRLAMVEAAVRGNGRFVVDTVEVEAGRAMYSVETAGLVKERWGEEGDEWYFVTGADEVTNLLNWREPDRLLEEVYMVAATRPGYDITNLDRLREALENFEKIVPVECTRVDVSATGIRRRVREGRSIRYLVPEGVYGIIERKGLYGAGIEGEAVVGKGSEGSVNGGRG